MFFVSGGGCFEGRFPGFLENLSQFSGSLNKNALPSLALFKKLV